MDWGFRFLHTGLGPAGSAGNHAVSSSTTPLTPTSAAVSSAAPRCDPACSGVPQPKENHHSQGCPTGMGGSTEGWEAKGTGLGTDFDLRGYLEFSWFSPFVKENKKMLI